jgi:hypothetical protein
MAREAEAMFSRLCARWERRKNVPFELFAPYAITKVGRLPSSPPPFLAFASSFSLHFAFLLFDVAGWAMGVESFIAGKYRLEKKRRKAHRITECKYPGLRLYSLTSSKEGIRSGIWYR